MLVDSVLDVKECYGRATFSEALLLLFVLGLPEDMMIKFEYMFAKSYVPGHWWTMLWGIRLRHSRAQWKE